VAIILAHQIEQLCINNYNKQQSDQAALAIASLMTGPFMHMHNALNRLKDHYGDLIYTKDFELPVYEEAQWQTAYERRMGIVNSYDVKFGNRSHKSVLRERQKSGKGTL
jgi:hypothetical protein